MLACSVSAAAQVPSAAIPEPVIVGGRLGRAYAPLLERLRSESLTLLFRHERTDITGRWDLEPFVAGACEQQRGVSDAGRASGRAVGTALQLLRLPVRRVIASPYCRTVESARVAFGGVHVVTPELIGADGRMRDLAAVRADLQRLIAREQPERGLLVLVAHHGTVDAVTTRMLDEGDALVLRRAADAGIEVLAHVPAARWEEIARDLDRTAYEPTDPPSLR